MTVRFFFLLVSHFYTVWWTFLVKNQHKNLRLFFSLSVLLAFWCTNGDLFHGIAPNTNYLIFLELPWKIYDYLGAAFPETFIKIFTKTFFSGINQKHSKIVKRLNMYSIKTRIIGFCHCHIRHRKTTCEHFKWRANGSLSHMHAS